MDKMKELDSGRGRQAGSIPGNNESLVRGTNCVHQCWYNPLPERPGKGIALRQGKLPAQLDRTQLHPKRDGFWPER